MYCRLLLANVVGKNMGKPVQNMQGSILFGKLMEIYQNQTMKYRIFTNIIEKDTNSIFQFVHKKANGTNDEKHFRKHIGFADILPLLRLNSRSRYMKIQEICHLRLGYICNYVC